MIFSGYTQNCTLEFNQSYYLNQYDNFTYTAQSYEQVTNGSFTYYGGVQYVSIMFNNSTTNFTMKVVDQHFKAAIAGARANITVNGYIITSQPSDEYGNLVFSSEYLPKQDNFNASFFMNDVRFYQKEFMFTVYYNTTRVVELTAYMAIRLNATTNSSSITGYNFSLYYLNSTMVGSRQTDMYGSAVMFVERVYVFNGM